MLHVHQDTLPRSLGAVQSRACHHAGVIRSLLVIASLASCSKPDETVAPPRIVELSASIEPLRRDFDAHRGEARFLTLLSPS